MRTPTVANTAVCVSPSLPPKTASIIPAAVGANAFAAPQLPDFYVLKSTIRHTGRFAYTRSRVWSSETSPKKVPGSSAQQKKKTSSFFRPCLPLSSLRPTALRIKTSVLLGNVLVAVNRARALKRGEKGRPKGWRGKTPTRQGEGYPPARTAIFATPRPTPHFASTCGFIPSFTLQV